MKCLPKVKIELAKGVTLHDCHAETLALRAFNHFLVQECRRILAKEEPKWVELQRQSRQTSSTDSVREAVHPFRIRADVRIYMYCSEAPCGDASMEIVMAEQGDATPWTLPADASKQEIGAQDSPLHGRGYFSELGIVRTKPSRPDAPPTWSKSCTDKLALKQCTSALNSITSTILSPENAYIDAIILPRSQHVPKAVERAFGPSGRFVHLSQDEMISWSNPYHYRPFYIAVTAQEFRFSKRRQPSSNVYVSSNISAVWTPDIQEVLINGALQGRKQFDPRGASALSRKRMWKTVVDLSSLCNHEVPGVDALHSPTYEELKGNSFLHERGKVKDSVRRVVLRPWPRNAGDESFAL